MILRYLPNALSLTRMILIIPLLWALFQGHYSIAFYIFLLAGISDGVDGFIARHYHCTSRFGSIADPIADKLLMISTLLALYWAKAVPMWLVFCVLLRDVVVVAGAIAYYMLIGSYQFMPSLLSKINTFFQLVLITLILLQQSYFVVSKELINGLMITVFITSLFSLAQYVFVWGRRARSLREPYNDSV